MAVEVDPTSGSAKVVPGQKNRGLNISQSMRVLRREHFMKRIQKAKLPLTLLVAALANGMRGGAGAFSGPGL
jgi:hypothetical protein